MQKTIIINTKTNFTISDLKSYFNQIQKNDKIKLNNFVFCLNHLSAHISEYYSQINFGVQSFFHDQLGSFTATNPLTQILEFKQIKYCLLGHFEELNFFKLSLKEINHKLIATLNSDLIPVVCFGNEQMLGFEQTVNLLITQLNQLLENVAKLHTIVLAYEPKYMIGSNLTVNETEINLLFQTLKQKLRKQYNCEFKLYYGGNVNQNNYQQLILQEHIDGLLIGRFGWSTTNIQWMSSFIKFLIKSFK